jgi:hypothetical protein
MDAAVTHKPLYGLMAEFSDPTSLVEAAKRTHAEGYRKVDAYTPFPMHELFDALEINDRRLQLGIYSGRLLNSSITIRAAFEKNSSTVSPRAARTRGNTFL